MKRWQDIIDRLKEQGDWQAAAALWDAREELKFLFLTARERHMLQKAADMLADDADREEGVARSETSAAIMGLLSRAAESRRQFKGA
jgi:hypothetical protein